MAGGMVAGTTGRRVGWSEKAERIGGGTEYHVTTVGEGVVTVGGCVVAGISGRGMGQSKAGEGGSSEY